MLNKIAIAAAALGMLLTAGTAQSADRKLFIQVWFEPTSSSARIDDGDDPGRFEVTVRDNFVGCSLAAFYKDNWGQTTLLPVSVGFTAVGRKEDVKIVVMGSLNRFMTMRSKITEMSEPLPAVANERLPTVAQK